MVPLTSRKCVPGDGPYSSEHVGRLIRKALRSRVCTVMAFILCIAHTQQQCHNSKFAIFHAKLLKVLKCCNFLWARRRHDCSPAASSANCVMTLYLLKVHQQMFLAIPVTQKCQILSCDTRVANERYVSCRLVPCVMCNTWMLKGVALWPLKLVDYVYRGADKALARPGRKRANVSVRMAWISFGALSCRKKTWRQLVSRCCWNRVRTQHASELVSFLVGLRTFQHLVTINK